MQLHLKRVPVKDGPMTDEAWLQYMSEAYLPFTSQFSLYLQYMQQLQTTIRYHVPECRRVGDFGMGPGLAAAHLLSAFPEIEEYHGFEYLRGLTELGARELPPVGNAVNRGVLKPYEGSDLSQALSLSSPLELDAIVSVNVIYIIKDDAGRQQFLENVRHHLAKDGVAIIASTMEPFARISSYTSFLLARESAFQFGRYYRGEANATEIRRFFKAIQAMTQWSARIGSEVKLTHDCMLELIGRSGLRQMDRSQAFYTPGVLQPLTRLNMNFAGGVQYVLGRRP